MFDEQKFDQDKPVSSFPLFCHFLSSSLHCHKWHDILSKGEIDWEIELMGIGLQIYIDAAQPERTISSRQARSMARKLNAGWRAVGLKEGDCVCMLSFNDVSTSSVLPLQ